MEFLEERVTKIDRIQLESSLEVLRNLRRMNSKVITRGQSAVD